MKKLFIYRFAFLHKCLSFLVFFLFVALSSFAAATGTGTAGDFSIYYYSDNSTAGPTFTVNGDGSITCEFSSNTYQHDAKFWCYYTPDQTIYNSYDVPGGLFASSSVSSINTNLGSYGWANRDALLVTLYASTSYTVTFKYDGGVVYVCDGSSCGAPPPTINTSESTLSGFSYCESSGPSSNQTYTVEGNNLTDDIIITPPTNYQISDDNSTWISNPSTITLDGSSGTVASTTIYVRLKSGLSSGDYNSEDITHTSTDATQQDLTCSGTITSPTITISDASFSGFSYCEGYGPSSNQSYTVSGSCLSENITITPPTNYEISDDNSTWVQNPSTITLSQSGGDVSETTIYVRLKSGLSASTYNSETITHTSSGATQQNLTSSGSVSAEPQISLASASQVSAANVEQATTKHIISAFTLAVTSNDATLTDIDFTTTGTYDAADITKIQLWYHTSNNLSAASQIGSNLTSSLGIGSHTFSSLSQIISSGNTGYFWITTDISAFATTSNTIGVSSLSTSDITFSGCNNKSGSISAGGTQTIIAATVITYYSRTNGNWNSNSTWSTAGCGGADASSYPSATDNVVICNTNTVTANVDIVSSGTVTVNSGGTLTVNNNIEIDSEIIVESGGTMNWPTTIEIGKNANIYVDGNISAGTTTVIFQDDYVDVNSGKIEANGTIAFSQLQSSTSTKGGSLKGSSITIATYGNGTTGVDVAFDGETTITTYKGYGYTYFTNGDLNITTYDSNNSGSVTNNDITGDDSHLNFTNKVTAKNSSLQTNITNGNIYFNSGFENAWSTNTPPTRLVADTVFISTELKGEGSTDLYIEANVVQQNNVAINQNSDGNIYIKNDFDSNSYETDFNNTNATLKIEGDSQFDNITGHLNSSASLITLGDSYMGGSGTFGANDGPIYVGGFLTIEEVQISFQGSAYGYIGNTATSTDYIDAGIYDGNYDGSTTIGGTGNHLRNTDNDPDLIEEGVYHSQAGGQITAASMIKSIDVAEADGLDVQPETWLPITLIEFYAEKSDYNYITLYWTTESEKNNEYFTVYRSNNGVDFTPIAEITGAGNSNQNIKYSYLDASYYTGISYYRLSQTDYDGTSTFSKIIAIYNCAENVTYKFIDNTVDVTFNDLQTRYHVMITSIDGRIIYSKGFYNTEQTTIQLPDETGIFIISTLSKHGIIDQKFIR